jgi:hypothetical protein
MPGPCFPAQAGQGLVLMQKQFFATFGLEI